MFKLFLSYLVFIFGVNDASATHLIQVVKILCGVFLYFAIRIYHLQSLYRLTVETHIIIIGGRNYGKFRPCINKTALLSCRKTGSLFINSLQTL